MPQRVRAQMGTAAGESCGPPYRSREADYGLCVFRLYRPQAYIDKMKESVKALFADGLVYLSRTRTPWPPKLRTHIRRIILGVAFACQLREVLLYGPSGREVYPLSGG